MEYIKEHDQQPQQSSFLEKRIISFRQGVCLTMSSGA